MSSTYSLNPVRNPETNQTEIAVYFGTANMGAYPDYGKAEAIALEIKAKREAAAERTAPTCRHCGATLITEGGITYCVTCSERQGEESEALYALEAGIVTQDDGSCAPYSNCATPAPALLELPAKIKPRRKPKKPACCVFCAGEAATGVFYCATGGEYIALSNGKHIAAGPKYLQVEIKLNDYHYANLQHGADANGEQAADLVAAKAA